MTQVELMENLAAFLKNVVREYESQQSDGSYTPITVYSGYLPVKTNAKESESCIYVLVLECEDGDEQSAAKVEIGFSIIDGDTSEGWRSLFNLMEHVRQALLKKRTVANKHRLILPIKSKVADEQPFPQWQGLMTVSYTLGNKLWLLTKKAVRPLSLNA